MLMFEEAMMAAATVHTVVVFGASGDLAKKKTLPSLFALYDMGLLPEPVCIVGYARTSMSDDDFRNRTQMFIHPSSTDSKDRLTRFLSLLTYVNGSYNDDIGFSKLAAHLSLREINASKESNLTTVRRLFYMALPPAVFLSVAEKLHTHLMSSPMGTNAIAIESIRVVVEKPFGKDAESSKHLTDSLSNLFDEDVIYRIDHYLGKELVKNLLVMRFANIFFSACWNRNYISNIQITFKEPFGVEGRGGYFEGNNIIRDVMQNHLTQILSLVCMEKPVSLDPEAIRDEKVKLLKCCKPIDLDDCVLGQYTRSSDGSKPGYLDEEGVPSDSVTPTFALTRIRIHNERWDGVPVVLKAGKSLNERKAEIRIQFVHPPGDIYGQIARNELVIRVQPNEAVYLKVMNKKPGLSNDTMVSELDLSYSERYFNSKIPDAYESLILNVLSGDHSNFVRSDELAEAWNIFTPLLHRIEAERTPVELYAYGSRGPAAADTFVRNMGYEHDKEYVWERRHVL